MYDSETRVQDLRQTRPRHRLPEEALSRTRLAEAAVSQAFNISLTELRAATRRKAPVAFARQMAMYLSHVALGVSLTRTGACFGRDRTTASHACRVIEERREDPIFDVQLCRLEESLLRMMRRLDGGDEGEAH